MEFGHGESLARLLSEVRDGMPANTQAKPLIDGVAVAGRVRAVPSPIDGAAVGMVTEGDEAVVRSAFAAAEAGFPAWNATPVETRAAALDRAADLVEEGRGPLIALLQAACGKTLDDALAEVRDAADLCRYYAAEARRRLTPEPLPGPTGESNERHHPGRGGFVCIRPRHFPLAL